MNIARFAVTRPVAVTMRIAALVLLGAICLLRLPVDLLPKVSIPTVVIFCNWPNVAPEEIEAQVARPLERFMSGVPNVYQVSTEVQEGTLSVRVQFRWGSDLDQGAIDVLQQVERARRDFPVDPTLQNPVVFKIDPSQLPIVIVGVSGEPNIVKLRTLVENQVAPLLETADGVGSISVTGGQPRAIVVDVDPARLRAHNVALNQISRRLIQENVNLPAGVAKQGDTEYTIRSQGWFKSVAQIADLPIQSISGRVVRISDVATVRDASAEMRMQSRLNGEPSVGLIVAKQTAANTVSTAENIRERLSQITKIYPQLKFNVVYDQSLFIKGSIVNLLEHAVIGSVLAILILLFFLRNFRSTLVVALSIPISVISTFALLYFGGFTINVMTLGGLALAVGLIVDDAVVVLENIFRHIERDRISAARASITGTNEIMTAVFSSTLTVIIVFLPMLLVKGQAGQMFMQFALVVIFSLLVSLLDAASVVPMMSSRLITGEAHHEESVGNKGGSVDRVFHRFSVWLDALDAAYRSALQSAMRRRALVVVGAAAVTLASFALWPMVGTELMPVTDSGDINLNIKLPPGTSLERTDATVREVERRLLAMPEVASTFAVSGTTLNIRGSTGALKPNEGYAMIKLREHRSKTTNQVMDTIRRALSDLPGTKAFPVQFDLVNNIIQGGPKTLQVDIFGEDLSVLFASGKEIAAKLRSVPGFENVDLNWQEATPEVQWDVDRVKALQLGVTFEDIATTLSAATNGAISSYFQDRGFQYPILVQLQQETRKSVPDLLNIPIRPSSGEIRSRDVLLQQVATPRYSVGPNQITRLDRRRYISVVGTPQGRSDSEVQAEIAALMKDVQLPKGYYWDWGAVQKRRAEEFSGMWLAVGLAVALIYMLLASQFESFVHPLTVLTSVPVSAVGVILALFLTGRPFGLTAFIGLLMLVGIVVKNGILLVDYTNVLRSRGIPRDEAVITAAPTRLRPILMTSSAAVLGMLPIAIGFGKGSETQAPMATAVVGGLITSTALTLFVVPVVYTLFDDLARRFGGGNRDLLHSELIGAVVEEGPLPEAASTPKPVNLG